MVRLETSMGEIVLELDDDKAPKTVANFLEYRE
jgi:peptidyl-prolyl cis-trans isomerase B (cyclophilin B)